MFFAGWFGFLLSPVKILGPEWAASVRELQFFGITVPLVAALSLLLFRLNVVGSDGESAKGNVL